MFGGTEIEDSTCDNRKLESLHTRTPGTGLVEALREIDGQFSIRQ